MTKGLRSKRQEDKNLPTWRRKGLRSKRREEISFITFLFCVIVINTRQRFYYASTPQPTLNNPRQRHLHISRANMEETSHSCANKGKKCFVLLEGQIRSHAQIVATHQE